MSTVPGVPPGGRRAFVTGGTSDGKMGGLSGADALRESQALANCNLQGRIICLEE